MSPTPLPVAPDSPVDDDEELRLDEEALAEMKATGSVSWEAVERWMLSWGKPDELPIPKIGD